MQLLYHSPSGRPVARSVVVFCEERGHDLVEVATLEDVIHTVYRIDAAAVILDGAEASPAALDLCVRLKRDAFTSVVPVIVVVEEASGEVAAAALVAGADEVLTGGVSDREWSLRLELALRRATRDLSVHPTTRLPGTAQIDREFNSRILSGRPFAACYADLDHFKEYNDRYGYHNGDRIILLTSMILRDIVRARAPDGFVGHIGGDDFIFTLPLEAMTGCCEEILELFDTLIPLQYSSEDRERGHFLGVDRRGNEYLVPLMSISIGVVTNERRTLVHPGEISAIAGEMKNFAKAFPGSVYLIDRRGGDPTSPSDLPGAGGSSAKGDQSL